MRWIIPLICAVAVQVWLATAAQALTFSEQEFTCPIGGEKFTSQVVGSYSRFGTRLDLKPIGALVAPLPLPVCPSNGFVMYQAAFTDDELAKLTMIVESDEYRTARAGHTDYYIAAFLLEKMDTPPLDLGHVYLKASWEAEEKRPDRVAEYQKLSLARFDTYLKSESEHNQDWWIAQIAAAALERRLGLFAQAIARIDAMPLDEGEARNQYGAFVAQIKSWALKEDSAPQDFKPAK